MNQMNDKHFDEEIICSNLVHHSFSHIFKDCDQHTHQKRRRTDEQTDVAGLFAAAAACNTISSSKATESAFVTGPLPSLLRPAG